MCYPSIKDAGTVSLFLRDIASYKTPRVTKVEGLGRERRGVRVPVTLVARHHTRGPVLAVCHLFIGEEDVRKVFLVRFLVKSITGSMKRPSLDIVNQIFRPEFSSGGRLLTTEIPTISLSTSNTLTGRSVRNPWTFH